MATDYKNTLNLPRTDFPMKADLVAREPERLKKWEAENLYTKIQAARAGAEKFVLHDGPPFANGDVHIGTALNKILKDIIVKYKTLRGFSAPYIPGWDCHGLPIEFKVSQEMRKRSAAVPAAAPTNSENPSGQTAAPTAAAETAALQFDAAAIRKACDAYARKYIDIQRTQFKRLGVLGDWDNPYLTLNKEYEADELRLFADIVEKGFVYRGKKPVYWSIPARTALAEAEVEYHDHVSQSIYVKFPVVGQPNTFVVIWTTTPWTLPANLAVTYNSTLQYVQVKVGDENYILFRGLLPTVAEKCGWSGYEERPFSTDELAKLQYQHPFIPKRIGKFFAGDAFVTNDTGTGFVHIAPGHGLDDYNLGRQNGLPIYSPVDDDGRFAHTNELPIEQQMPAEMVGKAILEKHGKSDANEAVLHELRVRHALLHQENYHHTYPYCWRSKTPVIFRAMDQWFIKVDHGQDEWKKLFDEVTNKPGWFNSLPMELNFDREKEGGLRSRAMIAVSEEVDWIPEWGATRILGALASRPDWCISRQRTWGVPIPAFYSAKGEPILDAQIVRNAADLIEKHGSNVWFEKSVSELWSLVKPKGWKGAEAAAKSNDTLDVWIDSGSSSRAVIARRTEIRGKDKPFQCDMYLEGSDQHRGWFQSSLLLSLAGNQDKEGKSAPPFRKVLTHGFMVDADREKISKSKQGQGVYEKPQTADAYVKKWGADIVRLWVASQDFRNDIIVSEERITKVAETYRGIRNALRYQLSNLYDFDPAQHTVADDKLTGLDIWILRQFSQLEMKVVAAYEAYEFHLVYQLISQFTAVELSAIYHDSAKDCLYTHAANSSKRRSKQTVLFRILKSMCQMLSPILSFTTDEAWEFLPGTREPAVHQSSWTDSPGLMLSNKAQWSDQRGRTAFFDIRHLVLPELEKARQAKLIGKSLDAKVEVLLEDDDLTRASVKESKDSVQELLNVSQLEVSFGKKTGLPLPRVKVAHADGQKCERCWHWETDVGSNPEHPTICARCVEAVQQFKQ